MGMSVNSPAKVHAAIRCGKTFFEPPTGAWMATSDELLTVAVRTEENGNWPTSRVVVSFISASNLDAWATFSMDAAGAHELIRQLQVAVADGSPAQKASSSNS